MSSLPASTSVVSLPNSEWRALPPIVNEALVHRFFYWNEQIQVGMRYGAELYTLLQVYPIEEQLKACEAACEQAVDGSHVCITVSKTAYSLWVPLRSPHAIQNNLSQN